MIFVTVGTSPFDFTRLVKKVDEIEPKIDEKIIIQTGYSNYEPKNCKTFDFLPREEYIDLIKKAELIIAHAGEGITIQSLRLSKPLILVPRLKKYGEHNDDHQLELLEKISETRNKVRYIKNIEDLKKAVKNIKSKKHGLEKENKKMIKYLKKKLKNNS